ncbi:hypothetical protein VNO78_27032 [Psophocarpus tetragonolobus]|uniref:Dof zinc finger protein n=1 Tax=Psophocarpus tetragonolobus TaxID=3891 RepID=A0AAN9X9W7_PSOTE
MVPPPEDMSLTPTDQDLNLGRKTNSVPRPAPEQGLKCPRCDSANTKFCYYNNYSLTQPRHFCKTCRRYWTNGGALRNVPIGGGCRKNKKAKASSSSSRFSCEFNFEGLTVPSNVEFGRLAFPSRLQTQHHTPVFNPFPSFGGDGSSSSLTNNVLSGFQQLEPRQVLSNSLMSLAPPSSDLWKLGRTQSSTTITDPLNPLTSAMHSMASMQPMLQQPSVNVNNNLASSIESLSNINLDLHLKLQQQRLAMMYDGDNVNNNNKHDDNYVNVFENQRLMQQPFNLFQNLEISKPENLPAGSSVNEGPSGAPTVTGTGTVPTEWFFGNSFPSVTHSAAPNNVNGNGNGINDVNNNWGGALAWGDLQHQQYSALP